MIDMFSEAPSSGRAVGIEKALAKRKPPSSVRRRLRVAGERRHDLDRADRYTAAYVGARDTPAAVQAECLRLHESCASHPREQDLVVPEHVGICT